MKRCVTTCDSALRRRREKVEGDKNAFRGQKEKKKISIGERESRQLSNLHENKIRRVALSIFTEIFEAIDSDHRNSSG